MTNTARTLFGYTTANSARVVDSTTAGTHTLFITGSTATAAGTLKFRVIKPLDVAATITPGTSLANADPIRVDLPTLGQNARFKVVITQADVNAGKVMSLQTSNITWPTNCCGSDYRILDSTGNTLASGGPSGNPSATTNPLTTLGPTRSSSI